MQASLVAVLGRGVVPTGTPVMRADDPGVLGEGLFETMLVRDGRPWLLDEHLDRLTASAPALGMAVPTSLADFVLAACAQWPAEVEGALRLVCTPMTAFCTISPVPPRVLSLRVRTLPASSGLPIKSLSYGPSLIARRQVAASGVDDALWVSPDGYALEGPTASLVWLDGETLCTVPPSAGVLPGVTAAWLLGQAPAQGWRAAHRMITPEDLLATDGAWLASSVRGLAEIRVLDGVELLPSLHTERLRSLVSRPPG
ncbi:aminotransferase class IV [Phytohabitans houttuyneae]|uniref:4-amino-4-deoxychorismate lyase n=1 Tax=Phytohabitans houttuyneae TaxID=1076126 RepID=A0A6V8KD21_9ACTN|nr:aminotransferase class IV [Phytohabitans houttuyneae]GFJ80321.1 4-amino-4-deoxychorismate lyase [Phytohabitans houttuyneae]